MSDEQRNIQATPGVYWAADKLEAFEAVLGERIRQYYRYLQRTGKSSLYRVSAKRYFGYDSSSGGTVRRRGVTYGGEQGEIVECSYNHYRSIIELITVMATSNRPAMTARPKNNDPESLLQKPLAEAICENALDTRGYERRLIDATKKFLRYAESWLELTWNQNAGEFHGYKERSSEAGQEGVYLQERPEGEEVDFDEVRKGEPVLRVYEPWNVVRDPDGSALDAQWVALRSRENKYDVASDYPEHREHILGTPSKEDVNGASTSLWADMAIDKSADKIYVYRFYHRRCAACPTGRTAVYVGGKVIADDVMFEGDEWPLYPMIDDTEEEMAFGSSRMHDLLEIQQIIDAAASTAASNHDAYGLMNIWTASGSSLQVHDLSGGLRHLQTTGAKPEIIGGANEAITSSLAYLQFNQQQAETLSGANSVVRGEPQANVKSGNFAALIYTTAQQYNSGTQRVYTSALEWLLTREIRLHQLYATIPRLIEIAGKTETTTAMEFTKEKLRNISRIAVEVGNSLMSNTAGRMQMAEMMFKAGEGITPDQVQEVMATGRIEPVSRRPRSQAALVQRENEILMGGGKNLQINDRPSMQMAQNPMTGQPMPQMVPPDYSVHAQTEDGPQSVSSMVTDDQICHVMGHLPNLDDPRVRANPDLLRANIAHIQGHFQHIATMPIHVALATGQEQLVQLRAAMAPQPTQPGQSAQQTEKSAQGKPKVGNNGQTVSDMPELPKNPATGEVAGA